MGLIIDCPHCDKDMDDEFVDFDFLDTEASKNAKCISGSDIICPHCNERFEVQITIEVRKE